jgi:hypothetical protein
VNKILTLCFVANGGDIDFIVCFRGMFDEFEILSWKARGFYPSLVLSEQTIDRLDSLVQ